MGDYAAFVAAIVYVWLSAIIGVSACKRGRAGSKWGLAAFLLSPPMVGLTLFALPDLRRDGAWNDLAAIAEWVRQQGGKS
jgi:hypothetical protein